MGQRACMWPTTASTNPSLANVEARNASPDRSHNETWDSLVITGVVGFLAYMLLFGSVFYFGFLWIGLDYHRDLNNCCSLVLWIVGAAAGALWCTDVAAQSYWVWRWRGRSWPASRYSWSSARSSAPLAKSEDMARVRAVAARSAAPHRHYLPPSSRTLSRFTPASPSPHPASTSGC